MSGKLISRLLIIIFYSFNIHPENMNTVKLIEQKIAEGKALLQAVGVWKYSLVKELKACGYDVDANKILL